MSIKWWAMSRAFFTPEQDTFLREHIGKCYTLHSLVDMFNAAFPEHRITYSNLGKRLQKIGIKKGTHNIRKGKAKSKNPVGTVIKGGNGGHGGHGARIKTENGYVSANAYFKKKIFGYTKSDKIIVNLNGDKTDFSIDNVELVSRPVYHSLCWRQWFFTDAELTKTAILTAKLLSFFPDLTHNENQYCKMKRIGE